MNYNVEYVRNQFPSLNSEVYEKAPAFFDGPGGTEVPQRVIDAMSYFLKNTNAIPGMGPFKTAVESDKVIWKSRETIANFVGANPEEIAFGQNATSLMYKLAFSLGREIQKGDEIIITEIDHEANRGPWQALEEQGAKIKEVKFDPDKKALDMEDFKNKVSEKTKIAAFNYAANTLGTISDVKTMIDMVHKVGGVTVIDAVHYAAHGVIDVKNLNVDFLLCSVYKFFGPHLGVLYGKKEIFEKLRPYKLIPQKDSIPYKLETGVPNLEGIAGAKEAINFIADLGSKFSNQKDKTSLEREQIIAGMDVIEVHESSLKKFLTEELSQIDKVNLYIPPKEIPKTSTISFTVDGYNSHDVVKALADKDIFATSGHFYALKTIERLGLEQVGGLVRIGLAPYNTQSDVERLLEIVKDL
ncbi:cysteine desulfurase-like protein [Natranaerobius trueperi]|uniref:Cysteine desulfurase-like protein n=1 Tax=Natranaerobius trueperi TaxID=759412 RepID=A0A226BXX7_9FIRM|nr:cysteine desulfurase-like protein [Natranaerobius trueperi]OWZ83856.1 cysteine desulfurase-like protein [Natranaerobius trueperi]